MKSSDLDMRSWWISRLTATFVVLASMAMVGLVGWAAWMNIREFGVFEPILSLVPIALATIMVIFVLLGIGRLLQLIRSRWG